MVILEGIAWGLMMTSGVIPSTVNGMSWNPIRMKTKAVRGSDYSPTIVLSEEKDKSVTENWRERKMDQSSFNFMGLTVPEKSATKFFNIWKLERKKNEEIKGWISSSSLIPVYTIYICQLSTCVPSFSLLASQFLRKVWPKILMFENWRKKNEEIKGRICSSNLIPVYTVHLPTVHVCTNNQPSKPHSSREKSDEKVQQNFLIFENWRERKMKK